MTALAHADVRRPGHRDTAFPRSPARRSVRHLGPNWYSSVMGTAVLATAGAALPVRVPGLAVAWALSALALALYVALVLAWCAACAGTVRGLVTGALPAAPRPAVRAPR